MSELTSSIYTVWRCLTRLLGEAQFPVSEQNPDNVVTYFGDPDLVPPRVEMSNERVVVAPAVGSTNEEWGPVGRLARNENFVAFLYAVTAVPGRDEEQARDRLEEITSVIEQTIRAVNAGRRTGSTPAEFEVYQDWQIEVGGLTPLVATTSEGAVGKAEIQIRCSFRIGTPPVGEQ